MVIDDFIWLPAVVEKLEIKHQGAMNESNEQGNEITSVSKARSLDEIAEYWDTHSLADDWDELPDVELEVRLVPRKRIVVVPELYEKLESRARQQGVSPETLANLWLAERLYEVG